MIFSILCCDNKYGLGRKNGLLFHLPLDMKFFKDTTINHVVAMGENTLLSFPGSKPLKDRTNIVLSQDTTHNYDGVINVHTFEDFLNTIKKYSKDEDVYIVGGASIYKQMLPYVDYVYLTKVNEDGNAEVFFINIDEDKNFELVTESGPFDDNGHKITFTTYKNLNKKDI